MMAEHGSGRPGNNSSCTVRQEVPTDALLCDDSSTRRGVRTAKCSNHFKLYMGRKVGCATRMNRMNPSWRLSEVIQYQISWQNRALVICPVT
jgi:hypothetical protein